ncbi:Hint domain-containing protein [Pseudoruegeria sp. SHC-113]|uniref:Hint domain-containing protein n=1 Tax=Pseudoruegeria sp. SHC-113 TaxID=2855439 RepID=UPI0021BADCA8|nr:Hint domain-containing protein [Pseudoruegeria sp. SHC-113]MCT8160351.1 Hint domain-containing protein [Pseudoruegeria sp. SHC-113]
MVANPSNPNNVTDTDSGLIDGGVVGDIDVTLGSVLAYPATDEQAELSSNVTFTEIAETINIAIVIDSSGSTANSSGTDFDGDGNNETILEAQLFAANELFQAYIDAGYTPEEVNITLIDYASTSDERGTFNLTEGDAFRQALQDIADDGPNGWTRYDLGLEEVEENWIANGVSADDTNIVIFASDGFPNPDGQDFNTPARALENDFGAVIKALGLGVNSSLEDLNTVATGDAVLITSGEQLLDVIVEPLIPVEFAGFEIFVEGELFEFIPVDDPRVILTPTGWSFECLVLDGYNLMPGDVLDVQVNAVFGEDPNIQTITNNLSIGVVVCFVEGTHILTPDGPVAVETLAIGDRVVTRDHGVQKVRWVGSSPVEPEIMAIKPALKPIFFAAGSLGKDLPERDLRVSRQHRFLVRDWRAEMMFGEPDGVLTPAFTLCNDSTIRMDHGKERVVYYHVAFENHEVIYAEGVETESFFPNRKTIEALPEDMREELLTLFPELLDKDEPDSIYTSARDQLKPRVGVLLS